MYTLAAFLAAFVLKTIIVRSDAAACDTLDQQPEWALRLGFGYRCALALGAVFCCIRLSTVMLSTYSLGQIIISVRFMWPDVKKVLSLLALTITAFALGFLVLLQYKNPRNLLGLKLRFILLLQHILQFLRCMDGEILLRNLISCPHLVISKICLTSLLMTYSMLLQ